MATRRYAFIALRVLSIYLGVLAIKSVISNLGPLIHERDAYTWAFVIGSFVPLVGAIVLWSAAETLAGRLSRVRPLTTSEIDSALDSEGDEVTEAKHPAEPREIIAGAALVLGIFFLVYGIRDVVLNGVNLMFFKAAGCPRFVGPGFLSRSCPFWTATTEQFVANGLAGVVSIAFGAWLLRDPLAFPETLGGLGRIVAGTDAPTAEEGRVR